MSAEPFVGDSDNVLFQKIAKNLYDNGSGGSGSGSGSGEPLLDAPANVVVTVQEAPDDANWDGVFDAVAGADHYEYIVDGQGAWTIAAGSPVSNWNSAGPHILAVRAVSASGVAGNIGFSNVFTLLAGGFSPALIAASTDLDTGDASPPFTVKLQFNGSDTITVDDGGEGGIVTPSIGAPGVTPLTITPTAGLSTFTFTYTPATDGEKIITVTNGQQWNDPDGITVTAITPPAYDPDAETTFISRFVSDDLNATLADNASIWNPNTGTDADVVHNGPGLPARVGSMFRNSPWSFGTAPILKKNQNGTVHSVVRTNNENTMRSPTPVTATRLLIMQAVVQRGGANGCGQLTLTDESSDDYDSVSEASFELGLAGKEYFRVYRNGGAPIISAIHQGIGYPHVRTIQWDGTNCKTYIGDWRSLEAASAGAFNATHIGIGSRHLSGGYNGNCQIDFFEQGIMAPALVDLDAKRNGYRENMNFRYNIQDPFIFIAAGDSISTGPVWPDALNTAWIGTGAMVENVSANGATLAQVGTNLSAADIYNRISERVVSGRTVVFIWEYVNAKNTQALTDTQLVDATFALGALVTAAGGIPFYGTDFHRAASSSCDAQGASDQMRTRCIADGRPYVELDLQSLRDSAAANDAGGGNIHPGASDNRAIITPLVRAKAEELLGI